MPVKDMVIEFDVRDWENEFWASFRIPFSAVNLENVLSIPGSANIKLVRV